MICYRGSGLYQNPVWLTAINLNMDKRKASYNVPVVAKVVGRKVCKTRQGHSKIFKNLSEFPIEINLDGKENLSIGTLNRPHSSLAPEPPLKHPLRIESALSHYPEPNRKRLSLDSTNKKHERESLLSRNSASKKASRHQIVIDDTTRLKLADDRRKYNSSCGSVADERRDTRKKLSQKPKRPSVNNLLLKGEKSQVRRGEGREGSVIRDKSKSKNKKGRKQSTTQLDKSKASTTAIAFPSKPDKTDKKFLKKKQSLSTAAINLPPREKKKRPKKADRVEIDDSSQAEYPINKYEVEAGVKKGPRPSLKGKSRRGSASKERERHKKTHSLIEIDYASCMNIPSNSSGLINSLESSAHDSKIKIIDNWEFRYFADEHPTSVNLEEMRYFEQRTNQKEQQEAEFVSRSFGSSRHYRKRKEIESEISEDYPNFSQLELKFLASVMFIQRKWREHRLYRQIFSGLARQQQLPSFIEKSNSKQLNISNGPKSAEKATKNTTQVESAQVATTPFSIEKEERLKEERSKDELREKSYGIRETRLNNNAYLEGREGEEKAFFEKGEDERKSSSSKQFCLKSQRYQFLESEIFPNITYLLLKKEQLREELHCRLHELALLQQNDALRYDEYQRLRGQYERQYERKLQELSRSKQDIKKGYLRFIDNYKDIRHQALRRVSSESGLMASMYGRLFRFDQAHITTPSDSSDSLRRLSRKVLIRKEFFLTQKVEPFIYNAAQLQEDSHLSARLPVPLQEQQMDLSARCFRSRRERREEEGRRKEMFIDIEGLSSDRLENKRIREGCVVSPHLEGRERFEEGKHTLSFTKSDELLPLTIKSPRPGHAHHEQLPQNHERKERLVLEEVIASLTHELYTELVSIDEKRESMVFAGEGDRLHCSDVRDLEMIEESRSEEGEAVEEEKLREIYKIEGLQEREKEAGQRRHRNSHQHNISPASSERYAFDSEDVLHYAKAFIAFLKANHLLEDIVLRLNKNQGFTPLEYLKFLRDFEIPEDEYDPLVSNQAFVDWEDFFSAKYYGSGSGGGQESEEDFVARQSVTIFHRCIFEAIIFLLEEFRPCGEKGIPFPWERVVYFPRQVRVGSMEGVLGRCVGRLEEAVRVGCGIIDEKYIVCNEEDLERIHEENEDKIINMLERELARSPHNWYEVEEHCLEIKLELECEIIEYLMLEALDEILEAY